MESHQQPAPQSPDIIHYLYPTASARKRFLNYLIDMITVQAILFLIGLGAGYLSIYVPGALRIFDGFQGFLLSLAIFFAYFAIMEATTGRTLGKILTNTLVLNRQDRKPTLKQILGRSAVRLIPFEPFSFLGTSESGWHDTLPGTKVVDTSKPPNVIGQDLTLRRALPPRSQAPPGSP